MNLRQIQDIAGHRNLSPWVIKLVQDCIEHDRMYERPNRAAMQMALEALEDVRIEYDFHGNPIDESNAAIEPAITALREALEVSSGGMKSNSGGMAHPQPQGEPVAWLEIDPQGENHALYMEYGDGHTKEDIKSGWKLLPLYTTPPSVEAAIEATKEKAAKVCERLQIGIPECSRIDEYIRECAAAIRSLK